MPAISLRSWIGWSALVAFSVSLLYPWSETEATVNVATRSAEHPTPQPPAAAEPRVSVRVAPSADPGATRQVLDAFDRYFEPTVQTFDGKEDLPAVSRAVCGHLNLEWLKRVRERNNLQNDSVPAGVPLTLPPCPYFRLGGEITVQAKDTVSGALLREVGQAGERTLGRVAAMNDTTPEALDRVAPGRTFKVDYVTSAVSQPVKAEFSKDIDKVVRALTTVPGAISARRDRELRLVGVDQPNCDGAPAADPFDANAVADVLEFNARIKKPRKATIGVIDTGVDKDEQRLFFEMGADGTVGANMDRRYPGFPTAFSGYENRSHGTHVAGLTLGGLQSSRLNILVRDRIHLRIINIITRDVLQNPITGAPEEEFGIPLTNLEEAVTYSQRNPQIPILNLSVETTTRLDAMRNTLAPGDYLMIVAAGNGKRDIGLHPSYPASFKAQLPFRMLTVAAILPNDSLAPFSNHGPDAVDLAAPGCEIRSILPGNKAGHMTGTSQAAPLVAFTAGLLYSEGLTLQDVRNRIQTSVRLVGPPLSDLLRTRGILDIPRAISVHEDLVTLKTGGPALRGRIASNKCLEVAGDCRAPAAIARLARLDANGPDGMAWLLADDGEVVVRSTSMPTGALQFRVHGASEDSAIPFSEIADILFARIRN